MKRVMKFFLISSLLLNIGSVLAFINIKDVSSGINDEINVTILLFKNVKEKIMDIACALQPGGFCNLIKKYPNDFKNLIGTEFSSSDGHALLGQDLDSDLKKLLRIDTELKIAEQLFRGTLNKSEIGSIQKELEENSIIYVLIQDKNENILRETFIFPRLIIDNEADSDSEKHWNLAYFKKDDNNFKASSGQNNFIERGMSSDKISISLNVTKYNKTIDIDAEWKD